MTSKRIFLVPLIVATAVCWVATDRAWGQEARATLGGRVLDAQGAVVPSAAVEVVSGDTGVKLKATTNIQGNWLVQFLIPGHYSFTVTAAGFKQAERSGITLQTADNKQFDVTLEVGAASQQIRVTAEGQLIDTTSATSGTVITPQEIREMPNSSRIPTLFATLSPGVMAQDQNSNILNLYSYNGASQITINGGRDNVRSNEFELDGMPNIKAGGSVAFIPPPDAVEEFRVVMNAYDASIGRQAGGTVQMTFRSGTAQYHGSLYDFFENKIFNANQFQANLVGSVPPHFIYNDYGGTFGGPVWIPKLYHGKQKTFFFISKDGLHKLGTNVAQFSVPTALERQGDFSQSFTTQLVSGQRVKYPIQVYDPLSVDASGNRTLFPGMVIPSNRLSPIAQKLQAITGLPNTPSDPSGNAINNYVANSPSTDFMALIAIRVDHNWNDTQKSFGNVRWSHYDGTSNNWFRNDSTGSLLTRIPKGFGVDHVWTVDPTKVLDLRFNLSRYEERTSPLSLNLDPTQFGFSSSFASQQAVPVVPYINGLFGNYLGATALSYTYTTYYSWLANFTQVKGNMTLHYGAEYWTLQQGSGNLGTQGEFDFGTNWTTQNAITGGGTGIGSTQAAFLLGLPQGGSFPRNATGLYSQHFWGLHFQDDWRVTPKLTINVGLRWDVELPVTERFNRLTSNFDPTAVNPINASAQAAYAQILSSNASNAAVQQLAQLVPASAFKVLGAQQFAGVNGQSRGVFNADYKQFQPRFGFAYRLGPNTVIRGGAGRFDQASFETAAQNGFSRSTSFIATQDNYFTPYDTLANPFRGGILAPTGSSLGPLTNLGQGVTWYDQNPSRMYSWVYSLHLQHELRGWLFEAGYTHNQTYNIWGGLNENNPSFALWKQLQTPTFDSTGMPVATLAWNQLVPNPFYQLPNVTGSIASSKTIALNQFLNPVNILGSITESDIPWGNNQYDALVSKIERRFTKGFSIIAAFTYSRQFNDTSYLGPQIAGHINHALGNEDRPLHLSIAPIWELPLGRGRHYWSSMPKVVDAFLGGWEMTGQFNIQSGLPVTFTTDSFFSGKDFALPSGKQSLSEWFDTSQFIAFPTKNTNIANYPAWTGIQNLPGYDYKPTASSGISNGVYQDFANYIRNYPTSWMDVRASRVNNIDAGIYKNFRMTERFRLQYRFETYNLFNHVRFPAPDTNPSDATFGAVTKTEQNPPRSIQMALKLYF